MSSSNPFAKRRSREQPTINSPSAISNLLKYQNALATWHIAFACQLIPASIQYLIVLCYAPTMVPLFSTPIHYLHMRFTTTPFSNHSQCLILSSTLPLPHPHEWYLSNGKVFPLRKPLGKSGPRCLMCCTLRTRCICQEKVLIAIRVATLHLLGNQKLNSTKRRYQPKKVGPKGSTSDLDI